MGQDTEPADYSAWLTLLGLLGSVATLISFALVGPKPAVWLLFLLFVSGVFVIGFRRFGRNFGLRLRVAAAMLRLSFSRRLNLCRSHSWSIVKRLSDVVLQLLARDNLDEEALEDIILEYGVLRPASPDQINRALTRTPVTDRIVDAANRDLRRRHLIDDMHATPMLFVRGGRHGPSRLEFVVTNFFVREQIGKAIRIKPDLLTVLTEQFGYERFDTVVFLKRDNTTDSIFELVNQVRDALHAQTAISFPSVESARRDPNWFANFTEACVGGKRIFLLETWLADDLLDRAFEDIQRYGGVLRGLSVIFQSSTFDTASLRNVSAFRSVCPDDKIEGQIILKLTVN